MHIVFIIESLSIGGAERVVCNLATAFNRHGWKVDVAVTSKYGQMKRELPQDVGVYSFISRRAILSVPKMISYFSEHRPDAVVSNLTHINVVSGVSIAIAGIETQFIAVEHNMMSTRIEQMKGNKEAVTAKLAGMIYRRADSVVAVSEGLAEDVAEITNIDQNSIETIYNPIATEDIKKHATEPVENVLFNQNTPVVLGIGSLTQQKDFTTLIRSFNKVRDQREAKLLIIGEGNRERRLKKLVDRLNIQEHVCFAGYVDNPYKYLFNADVFVLSSAWEGLGNVLVEALACGTPCVSTDCKSGPYEILEGGKWGSLVPVGDEERMASAILSCINEDHQEKTLQKRADEFNITKSFEAYRDIILDG